MAGPVSLQEVAHTRVPFSTWLAVVLIFIGFGALVLAVVGPMPRTNEYEQKRAKARFEKLKAQREEDAKALTGYGWIDKNKGIARVTIARAMELTIAQLSQKSPAPAYPIATATPQASVSPAASASPTTKASPSPAPATTPQASASPTAAAAPAAPTPKPTPSPTPTPTPKPIAVEGPKSEAAGQPAAAINPPAPPGQPPKPSPSPSPTRSP